MSSNITFPFKKCTELSGDFDDPLYVGQDHTRTLLVLGGYIGLIAVTFIFFAKNKLKRTNANQSSEGQQVVSKESTQKDPSPEVVSM